MRKQGHGTAGGGKQRLAGHDRAAGPRGGREGNQRGGLRQRPSAEATRGTA
jgi:hypothetical protein